MVNIEVLRRFCWPFGAYHEQWRWNGWAYATNGCILVRCPSEGMNMGNCNFLSNGGKRAANAERLIANAKRTSHYGPLILEFEDAQNPIQCKCRGMVDCDACGGSGLTGSGLGVVFRDQCFSWCYVRHLVGLPTLRVAEMVDGMMFTFDGGEGILLGCKDEKVGDN